MPNTRIRCISSMATRQVLAELAAAYERACGDAVAIESVGGVDAERRVRSGESFDLVVLAADALARLVDAGRVAAASARGLLRSQVAVAVPAGAPHPDIASEDAVRSAVLAARRIGCSTGPSGVQLARLFERWGLAEQTRQRLVQAPPGIPVGSLLARGEVDLGFQQLSELMHMQGVDVLGCLPPGLEIVTTFSAGLGIDSAQGDAVRRLLEFMASPQAAETARRHGMELA